MLSQKKIAKKKRNVRTKNVTCRKLSKASMSLTSITTVEKMTPKKLRSFKGFEKVTQKEATHIIESLEAYCKIVLCQLRLEK